MQSACETKGLAMEVTSAKITALTTSTSTSGCTNSNANSDKMNYALQVALQTIKERCIQLQRRVAKMEEENQRLREVSSRTEGAPPLVTGINGDVLSLRAQVSELQRQKEQLEEHIGMVSNENRRLWSRLSQISKDQQQLHPVPSSPAQQNQNLVRSKTFTQHSPNPHLRQKMLSDGLKDLSLEEIALDDFGASNEELGYPYNLQKVEESTSESPDANVDAKRCMDGLQEMRREAMKQQQELSSALTLLEGRIELQPCPECAQKTAKKPEMADKSLETDDSLTSELKIHESQHNGTPPSQRINIIQEKIKADAADAMEKTCPMCGKLYSSQVSFNAFREHVEMHFIDDDALDFEPAENSVERQFEFISHAVGDF
ncbi:protein spindle-F [Drosophila gunungcola]|uniref:protein spindle-F n=1 Tax=Drosophila gunungcola TaxID=103775 RepID=UPI0022E80520|nr:protein spindle-F [Drosophila gunungcola]